RGVEIGRDSLLERDHEAVLARVVGPQDGDDRALERLRRRAGQPHHRAPPTWDRYSAVKGEENLARELRPFREEERLAAPGLHAPDDPQLAPLEHLHDLVGVPFPPRLEKAGDDEIAVESGARGERRDEKIVLAFPDSHESVTETGALEAADARADGHRG